MRPATPDLDPAYLAWLLRSPHFQIQAEALGGGSVLRHFGPSHLRTMSVVLPPIDEQRAIAGLLDALYDKSVSNDRAITALDLVIREAVRSVMPRPGSGTGSTAALGTLVQQVKEAVTPSNSGGLVYVGLEHMPRGRLFVDQWGIGDSVASNKWRFEVGDVLFGKLRPYFKKVGVLPVPGICSTDILVLRPRDPALFAVLVTVLASDEVVDFASSASTGTRMPRASWDHIATWQLELPREEEIAALNHFLGPFLELGSHLVLEARSIAALQSALLPELLSGPCLSG